MTRRRRLRSAARMGVLASLVVALVIVAGAAPGCYGATEVQVEVTTTVACAPAGAGITTQIFTSATGTRDFGTAPAAETERCVLSEPRVGTLSVVPSGARDGQFDLEVVGAVGVPTADCRDASLGLDGGPPAPVTPAGKGRTGCIVARRRVSFRPHKSLGFSVRLDESCIGVPCGVDQTCDVGICTPTADCTELGCPRERADVTIEAGADAPTIDAPVDAGAACGPVPEVVIANQSIASRLVLSRNDFLYANNIPAPDGGTTIEIRSLPRTGATAPAVRFAALPPEVPAKLSFIAANGSQFALFSNPTDLPGTDITLGSLDDPDAASYRYAGGQGAVRPVAGFAGSTLVGFWHTPSGTDETFAITYPDGLFVTSVPTLSLASDVAEVLADDEAHYYGVASPTTLIHLQLVGGGVAEVGRIANLGTIVGDLALAGHTLYVGATAPRGAGVFRIPREAITSSYADLPWLALPAPPVSMTSDGAALYYLSNGALSRAELVASAPAAIALTSTGANADRLEVDDQCVYWVEDGTRIMKRAKR